MFKKLSLMIFAASITIVIFNSCEKGTEPEEQKQESRDYEWTIDTIDPGPTYLTYSFNIWGASPDDVWLVGSANTRLHTTWHYDGQKWDVVEIDGFVEGGGIWGFGSNNIWLGTFNSSIWHFNGKSWTKFGDYKYKDYDRVLIVQIHGINEDEVYGVGFADMFDGSKKTRLLMKNDGVEWNFVEIPELDETFYQVKVDGQSGNVFITAERFNRNDGYLHLYLYKNNKITEIATSDNFMTLGNIGKRTYITMESLIFTYENDKLILFKDFSSTEFLSRIWGRNETDFFTATFPSDLGHFDGSGLKTIFKIDANINRAVLFDKEIFVHARDHKRPFRDLVIHGKLK